MRTTIRCAGPNEHDRMINGRFTDMPRMMRKHNKPTI